MIADHFRWLGMSEQDAASRAALVTDVQRRFVDAAGAPPRWCWFVPGRLEVFGTHTDYAGGRVLIAALPRGFAVAAGPREDGRVVVRDARDGSRAETDPMAPATGVRGWASYVEVVARRLAANFPGSHLGADIVFQSDLPRAAGLSSSSALIVGIATALIRRAGLTGRDEWRANVTDTLDLAGYLACIESGHDHRGLLGTSGVGTHGGSEDHTAILAGRAGHLGQYRFARVAHLGDVQFPGDWTFVVATSGVRADKAGAVRDRYNRLSGLASVLLARWNQTASTPATSLAAALATPGALAALEGAIASGQADEPTAAELRARLAHFVAEDARVADAALAFARADAATLGALAAASQRQGDTWLGNQVPETRALVAAAVEAGALAARGFGAGFGGSVWALAPSGEATALAGRWLARYARLVPAAAPPEWFVSRPGPALTEVPV